MRKLFYTIAIISALATASFAEETKSTPVQKPESMPQNEWKGRVLGALDELRENPSYYDFFKDQKNLKPEIQEALRIYKENYLK